MSKKRKEYPEAGQEWNFKASTILRVEMLRRDITAENLSKKLREFDADLEPHALNNKIRRGTFTLAFFLQCMVAMGVRDLDLYLAYGNPNAPAVRGAGKRPMKLIDDDNPPFDEKG